MLLLLRPEPGGAAPAAITYQREVASGSVADSIATQDVAVGAAGVPVGALVVVVMTKNIAMTPSVTDSKGNVYVVHEQRNEALDTAEVAIASSVLTTALVNGDNVIPNWGATFSEKTWQVHEFRSTGTIAFSEASGATSTFPHSTKSAGTLTDTTDKLVVGGFVANTASSVTWTAGTGFTSLASLDPGSYPGYAEYDLAGAGASHTVQATSTVDAANAGVSACWTATAAGGAAPTPTLVSQSRSKISRVSGFDSTSVVWTSDMAFIGYQFRVVNSASDPVSQGVQIEANQDPPSGGAAGTQYTSTITDDEIEAVSPAEGAKIVKLFLQNANGWSA